MAEVVISGATIENVVSSDANECSDDHWKQRREYQGDSKRSVVNTIGVYKQTNKRKLTWERRIPVKKLSLPVPLNNNASAIILLTQLNPIWY